MKLASLKKRKGLEINMTPMIDVVFLLLIFFMTCSQVSDVSREQIPLPKLPGSEDQANSEIIVNVKQDGEIVVLSEPYTVPQFLAMCVDEAQLGHAGDASQLAISMRIHRDATCRTANELVQGLTKLGVTKVRFGVESSP